MSTKCEACKAHYSDKTKTYIPACIEHDAKTCPRIGSCSRCGSISHASATCKYYGTGKMHPSLTAAAPPKRITSIPIDEEHIIYIPTEDKPLRALMKKMGVQRFHKREENLEAMKTWCQEQRIRGIVK